MLSFLSKALEQLGIGDIDDDDEYFEEEFEDEQEEQPDEDYRYRVNESSRDKRIAGATLKPLSQESRDTRNPFPVKPINTELAVKQNQFRTVAQPKAPQPKVHIVAPEEFSDAKEIGDLVKTNIPVILNLVTTQRDLARRMLDFCSGLTYAVSGSMSDVVLFE